MQNSGLRSRLTLVYWSQPSSVVLCIQNSDFSIRNTSLNASQPSFLAFARKTATLGPELQVSMGPTISPIFFCIQNNDIMTRINSLYRYQTSPVILCMQNRVINTRITSLLVPRPHLSFCACKTE